MSFNIEKFKTQAAEWQPDPIVRALSSVSTVIEDLIVKGASYLDILNLLSTAGLSVTEDKLKDWILGDLKQLMLDAGTWPGTQALDSKVEVGKREKQAGRTRRPDVPDGRLSIHTLKSRLSQRGVTAQRVHDELERLNILRIRKTAVSDGKFQFMKNGETDRGHHPFFLTSDFRNSVVDKDIGLKFLGTLTLPEDVCLLIIGHMASSINDGLTQEQYDQRLQEMYWRELLANYGVVKPTVVKEESVQAEPVTPECETPEESPAEGVTDADNEPVEHKWLSYTELQTILFRKHIKFDVFKRALATEEYIQFHNKAFIWYDTCDFIRQETVAGSDGVVDWEKSTYREDILEKLGVTR